MAAYRWNKAKKLKDLQPENAQFRRAMTKLRSLRTIIALACQYDGYGYRRITALLQLAG